MPLTWPHLINNRCLRNRGKSTPLNFLSVRQQATVEEHRLLLLANPAVTQSPSLTGARKILHAGEQVSKVTLYLHFKKRRSSHPNGFNPCDPTVRTDNMRQSLSRGSCFGGYS